MLRSDQNWHTTLLRFPENKLFDNLFDQRKKDRVHYPLSVFQSYTEASSDFLKKCFNAS